MLIIFVCLICRDKEVKGERDFRAAIASYRSCDLTLSSFNQLFGVIIEVNKTFMSMFCIAASFLLIKHNKDLSLNLLSFLIFAVTFTLTVPPLLYQEACKTGENSEMIRRRLGAALVTIRERNGRGLQRRRRACKEELCSVRPLRIRVAGMYFLDSSMTATYLMVIVNYTATALLSY